MNNEPVAWINREDGSSVLDWDKDPYAQKHIPLYAHPHSEESVKVKELTDEEIVETVKDHFIGAIKVGIVLTNDNVLDFARAILRKAQEK